MLSGAVPQDIELSPQYVGNKYVMFGHQQTDFPLAHGGLDCSLRVTPVKTK